MSYYRQGLAVESNMLPERVRAFSLAAGDFHRGSRRFYDAEIIGAASGTPFGTLADGLVAIVLDAVHVLLMVGGFIFMMREIFP